MSATITAPVNTGSSSVHAVRIALVTLAIVALLAVAFVVGRVTTSSAHSSPAIAPAVPTAGIHTTPSTCRMGRPC
jgi:hypothetical protein